jgi:hypothetical protein
MKSEVVQRLRGLSVASCVVMLASVCVLVSPVVNGGIAATAGPDQRLACGPRVLSIAAAFQQRTIASADLVRAFGGDVDEIKTLEEIRQAAHEMGMATYAVELNPKDPTLARMPLIVRLKGQQADDPGHFVVLYGSVEQRLQLVDFPRRARLVAIERVAIDWDGRGLYVGRTEAELHAALGVSAHESLVHGSLWIVLTSAVTLFGLSVRSRKKELSER